MSVAKGLQIHSNVSIPLSPQIAEEQTATSPMGLIEHEERHRDIFIGKKKFKGFLVGSSLTLFFIYALIMTIVVFFLLMNRKKFKALFRNYEDAGNGYDIAAIVLLFLTLVLITVAPTYGRKAWRVPFFVIIFITVPYLSLHGMDPGPDYAAWLQNLVPTATVEVWPDMGHYLHLVDPGRFLARLAAFEVQVRG